LGEGNLSLLRTPTGRLSAGQIAKTENERFADRIVHGGSFAMGSYQTGLAEDAEMFGSVGLLETAGALDVAHTAGTGAQGIEDAQAGGVG
jgi:hypothetical protein